MIYKESSNWKKRKNLGKLINSKIYASTQETRKEINQFFKELIEKLIGKHSIILSEFSLLENKILHSPNKIQYSNMNKYKLNFPIKFLDSRGLREIDCVLFDFFYDKHKKNIIFRAFIHFSEFQNFIWDIRPFYCNDQEIFERFLKPLGLETGFIIQ